MKLLVVIFLNLINFLLIKSESVKIANINIEWKNRGDQTDFILSSDNLGRGLSISNAWIGFGFNSRMNSANVIICKSKPNNGSSVEHYYNNRYRSNLLVGDSPAIGISNSKIETKNGILKCSFTRDNVKSATHYFQINNSTKSYMIVAAGAFSSSGALKAHKIDGVSKNSLTFHESNSINDSLAETTTTQPTDSESNSSED